MNPEREARPLFWIVIGAVMTLALCVLLVAWLKARAEAEREDAMRRGRPEFLIDQEPLKRVPDFRLQRARGGELSRADLAGRVWVVDFFFTTCPTVCPVMSGRLRDLQGRLADLPEVKLVSITVDPAKDDAETLRAYADRFEAEPDRWYFLTGEEPVIRDLKHRGFGIGDPDDPIMGHSTRFGLIDADGMIRAYYHCANGSESDDFPRLLADIRELVRRGGR
ncbi:MAG: SCO family protein [Planctomycetota bacterium]